MNPSYKCKAMHLFLGSITAIGPHSFSFKIASCSEPDACVIVCDGESGAYDITAYLFLSVVKNKRSVGMALWRKGSKVQILPRIGRSSKRLSVTLAPVSDVPAALPDDSLDLS